VGGGVGYVNNLPLIVGSWALSNIETVDTRNDSIFTNYNVSPSSLATKGNYVDYLETHEFSANGSILITDNEGNTNNSSSFEIIDSTRMIYGYKGSVNAYLTGSLAIAIYKVSTTSLIITYVLTNNSVDAYSETNNLPYTLISSAGDKQVVTATITYRKIPIIIAPILF
jgi:hypothetical protein